MFNWLGALFRFIGHFGCRVQIAAVLFFIAILLSLVGLVAGFDLNDVDLWLQAHGGFFSAVGNVLFRIGCGFVLLCCVAAVLGAIFDRPKRAPGPDAAPRDLLAPPPAPPPAPDVDPDAAKPIGIGCALLALVVGYFAWVGMVG